MKYNSKQIIYLSFIIAFLIHLFLLQNIDFSYEIAKEKDVSKKVLSITINEIVSSSPTKNVKEEERLNNKIEESAKEANEIKEKIPIPEKLEPVKEKKIEKPIEREILKEDENKELEEIRNNKQDQTKNKTTDKEINQKILEKDLEEEKKLQIDNEINNKKESDTQINEINRKEDKNIFYELANEESLPNMIELLKINNKIKFDENLFIEENDTEGSNKRINDNIENTEVKGLKSTENRKTFKEQEIKKAANNNKTKEIQRIDFSKIKNNEGYELPDLVTFIKPVYPESLLKRGIEGQVKLKVLLNINGGVKEIEILKSSGFNKMDEAAIDAVTQWLFKPGKKDNQSVESIIIIPISFKIN
jgi:TonB family protein